MLVFMRPAGTLVSRTLQRIFGASAAPADHTSAASVARSNPSQWLLGSLPSGLLRSTDTGDGSASPHATGGTAGANVLQTCLLYSAHLFACVRYGRMPFPNACMSLWVWVYLSLQMPVKPSYLAPVCLGVVGGRADLPALGLSFGQQGGANPEGRLGGVVLPLYADGRDRTRFAYAVYLLNKDVELLMQVCKGHTHTYTHIQCCSLRYAHTRSERFGMVCSCVLWRVCRPTVLRAQGPITC